MITQYYTFIFFFDFRLADWHEEIKLLSKQLMRDNDCVFSFRIRIEQTMADTKQAPPFLPKRSGYRRVQKSI